MGKKNRNPEIMKVMEICRDFSIKCELMPDEFVEALASFLEKGMVKEVEAILHVVSMLILDLSYCLRELKYCGGEWEPESWGHIASPLPQVPLGNY